MTSSAVLHTSSAWPCADAYAEARSSGRHARTPWSIASIGSSMAGGGQQQAHTSDSARRVGDCAIAALPPCAAARRAVAGGGEGIVHCWLCGYYVLELGLLCCRFDVWGHWVGGVVGIGVRMLLVCATNAGTEVAFHLAAWPSPSPKFRTCREG